MAASIDLGYNVIDLEDGKLRRFNFWVINWGRSSARNVSVELRYEGIRNDSRGTILPIMDKGGFVIVENRVLPPERSADKRLGFNIDFLVYYHVGLNSFSLEWLKETRQGDEIITRWEQRGPYPYSNPSISVMITWDSKETTNHFEQSYMLKPANVEGRPELVKRALFKFGGNIMNFYGKISPKAYLQLSVK